MMPSVRGNPSCPAVPRRQERRRERLTAAPQSKRQLTNKDINKKAWLPKKPGFFPSGDPNRFVTVTEGHDAERARKSIMPRSAAT